VDEVLTVDEGENHDRMAKLVGVTAPVKMLKSVDEGGNHGSGTEVVGVLELLDWSEPVTEIVAVSELLEVIVRLVEIPLPIFEELVDAVQMKPLAP
jgi:hypothetical protein